MSCTLERLQHGSTLVHPVPLLFEDRPIAVDLGTHVLDQVFVVCRELLSMDIAGEERIFAH